jgi:hypothetical protein
MIVEAQGRLPHRRTLEPGVRGHRREPRRRERLFTPNDERIETGSGVAGEQKARSVKTRRAIQRRVEARWARLNVAA